NSLYNARIGARRRRTDPLAGSPAWLERRRNSQFIPVHFCDADGDWLAVLADMLMARFVAPFLSMTAFEILYPRPPITRPQSDGFLFHLANIFVSGAVALNPCFGKCFYRGRGFL